MKATYDSEARAIYIYVDREEREVKQTVAVFEHLNIDLNSENEIVGYEFIGVDRLEDITSPHG